MPVSELLPRLQELPRRDKLMLVQYLVSELAREEGIEPLESSASYAVTEISLTTDNWQLTTDH